MTEKTSSQKTKETRFRTENPYLKETDFEGREYQSSIAQACLMKNSLVVLPTGLGKTLIAVLVAAETLKLYPSDSKVVVLAPTRPLIDQHYHSFLKLFTIPEQKYAILTGKVNYADRIEAFENCQMIFYTPQTLRNDLVNQRYTLEKVCLIVFDEAHHATGDYPYPLIADEYTDQNPDGNILGLTASPGASKDKIKELCKSLHIPFENIHIRTRQDKDVKDYVKPLEFLKVGVDLTSLMKDIYKRITFVAEERVRYLVQTNLLQVKGEVTFEKVFRKDLLKLNQKLIESIATAEHKSPLYSAISINAQALILYHMTELIEQQGFDILLIYMEKMYKDARRNNSSKAIKRLASDPKLHYIHLQLKKYYDLSPNELIHPKYKLLEQILKDEIGKNPEVKVLVFVKLRDSVKNIVDKLKRNSQIRPVRFVGQATKSVRDKGLSQKEQIEILEQFKRGKYNVLVSTNVGEEGLDIAECDLVIFYDVVASEIRLIQRKGRTARQREGKAIILYCKNTHDEIYLQIALKRLERMNKNLKKPKSSGNPSHQDASILTTELKRNHAKIKEKKVQHNNLMTFIQSNQYSSILKEEKRFEAQILLSRSLPMKLGLRKKLLKENITYQILASDIDVILFNKVVIQIFDPYVFSEDLPIKVREFNEDQKKIFPLVLNVFDFINLRPSEQFEGETTLLKRKIQEFANNHGLKIIPIDTAEEFLFIIKNIMEQNGKN